MFRVSKVSIRFHSTKILNNESIYVVSIPITAKKSYIYCNHKPSILPKSQTNTIPLVNRVETKVTSIATKGWNKLNNSDKSWNIKIVSLIRKLLNTIPYEENCLKSFPSKSAMIREINEEADQNNQIDILKNTVNSASNNASNNFSNNASNNASNNISDNASSNTSNNVSLYLQSEIDSKNIKQLKPIPFYYPNFQNPNDLLHQLHHFRDNAYSKHYKYAWLCAIGLPLSLPVALIPVVPNVPGFYLAYRLYCHIKALQGVNHLNYLLESENNEDSENVLNTTHLNFISLDLIDGLYNNIEIENHDQVIINEDIIEKLTNRLNLPHLKQDLIKAMNQETNYLNQQKLNHTKDSN